MSMYLEIVGESATKWSIDGKAVISMLMGTYSHSLDAKGRLIVPARIREELGDIFILTRNQDGCLSLYPKHEWDLFKEKLEQLPKISSEAARRLRRFYFGNSLEMEIDKQGRVLIPVEFRSFAGLTRDITLVGVDDHAEIWDEAKWNLYNENTDLSALSYDLEGLNL